MKKLLFTISSFVLAAPSFLFAQGSQSVDNPIGAFSSIPALIAAIVNVFLIIAVPIIVFFLIYAGFLYVTAQGNPMKIQQAHKALVYGLVGGVIIIGARVITAIVQNTVTSF